MTEKQEKWEKARSYGQTTLESLALLCDADNRNKSKLPHLTIQDANQIAKDVEEAERFKIKSIETDCGFDITISFQGSSSRISIDLDKDSGKARVIQHTSDHEAELDYDVNYTNWAYFYKQKN